MWKVGVVNCSVRRPVWAACARGYSGAGVDSCPIPIFTPRPVCPVRPPWAGWSTRGTSASKAGSGRGPVASVAVSSDARPAGPTMPSGRQLPGFTGTVVMAVLSICCLVAFLVLAGLVVSGWQPMVQSDLAIDTELHSVATRSSLLVGLAVALSWTGGPLGVTVLSTAIVVVLAVRGRVGFALFLAATALGGVALSESAKDWVDRARPVWSDPLWSAEGASFPSGHSMAGITNWVVYGVLILLLVPGRRAWVPALALMTWGLLMAPSRLVLGVHWPSDVIGGWLLGFAWVLAVCVVSVSLVRRQVARPAAPV